MIYPDNFEEKIGINTIREFIIEKCHSVLGVEKVESMAFSSDYTTVSEWLEQTHEFLQIIQNKEDFPVYNYLDLRQALINIDKDPTVWFSEEDVSGLGNSLMAVDRITAFLNNSRASDNSIKYPILHTMSGKIKTFPQFVEKTYSILDKSGRIKDNASHLLADIRKNKTEAAKDITRNMQAAIRNAQSQGIVSKEVFPDMRNGYLVIPVIASYKRRIKGEVRGDSGSGRTVYIEPEAVVEATNRLKELEADERREVIRILTEFTNMLRPEVADLLISYDFLGTIDFIRAKALFSARINAVKPVFENKQQMNWIQAVHPLLNITLRQQNKKAVPLDIVLNQENRILVVSGVNAGGKSLCLKTAALLQYMLQCGLLIPVRSDSHAGIFDHIFIDIGDGQSMENSLSTYTSHLKNMKFFVEHNDDKTLLLIDEFGSGTEPQIGGAIAETLLERFNRKHSFGLITTHFQNLKQFAYETKGIVNGAMLYDVEEMKPLYKLAIGNPGSSFAIEVARKTGLPEDVIMDSAERIGTEFANMDNLLQSIVRDKLYWEKKRKEVEVSEGQSCSDCVGETLNENREIETAAEVSVVGIGDRVKLEDQAAIGTVLDIKGKQATVVFGAIKSIVKYERLIRFE
ncbi:DNA mismatch repair protein MutS [Elizabethkingia anophelis]|nr:DNA mismatch repair protein MutS [Elizabethkingia anophelis]